MVWYQSTVCLFGDVSSPWINPILIYCRRERSLCWPPDRKWYCFSKDWAHDQRSLGPSQTPAATPCWPRYCRETSANSRHQRPGPCCDRVSHQSMNLQSSSSKHASDGKKETIRFGVNCWQNPSKFPSSSTHHTLCLYLCLPGVTWQIWALITTATQLPVYLESSLI